MLASVALASMVKLASTVSGATPLPCAPRLGWPWFMPAVATFSFTARGERWDRPDLALRLEVPAQGHTGHLEMGFRADSLCLCVAVWALAGMCVWGGCCVSLEGWRLGHTGRGPSQLLGLLLSSLWGKQGFLLPPAFDSL